MKVWLGVALLAVASLMAGAAWFVAPGPTPERVAIPPLPPPPALPELRPPAVAAAPAQVRITPLPAIEQAPVARLNAEEAQALMQLMAAQGDPRSPVLLPGRPRVKASAAELADPRLYAQFEDRQAREQILAYTAGVQQIPAIRERIEQAAQSGERYAEELDEARAALEQLEQLQSRLEREAPHLLPFPLP
ncbi:MAG TPA: hypothetical protein VJA19_20685 [Pseudomonas sp.]|nr:hypothetical protein [Pseudomonas sp.]